MGKTFNSSILEIVNEINHKEIFRGGEIIKALISEIDLEKGRIGLNTALLENTAGELIIDKQKVMQEASERALKTRALFDKKEKDK